MKMFGRGGRVVFTEKIICETGPITLFSIDGIRIDGSLTSSGKRILGSNKVVGISTIDWPSSDILLLGQDEKAKDTIITFRENCGSPNQSLKIKNIGDNKAVVKFSPGDLLDGVENATITFPKYGFLNLFKQDEHIYICLGEQLSASKKKRW